MGKKSKEFLKARFLDVLLKDFNSVPEEASDFQIYKAISTVVAGVLREKRQSYINRVHSVGQKQVYYLSMEFLMGRSLKTNIYNLEIVDEVRGVLSDFNVNLDRIYNYEPDAGLGNGGLGRLAACYLDGLATTEKAATGYSICYEYGIFQQRIQDGWQTEIKDDWLPGGGVWLDPKPEQAIEVHFDGEIQEYWENQYHHVSLVNYSTIIAIPYDMYVTGYDSDAISVLRLWQAKSPNFDMASFNQGDYAKAFGNPIANSISKVLYPNDNHLEGKSLRLRQQYFMCAASVGDIVNSHMSVYGTLENLADKVAIHINDTHPTLAIPELMRIFLDDCGYSWEMSWEVCKKTFAYTNHTVMAEALEKWDINLMRTVLPRIFSIIVEINNRYCAELMEKTYGDNEKVANMSIISNNVVHMARLCVATCHHVNGVSSLHSEIIKESVFKNEYSVTPEKFTNVTNGIAYRRWLYQSNPELTKLLKEIIGDKFLRNGDELKKLFDFKDDKDVLGKLETIKSDNKLRFAEYVKRISNKERTLDPSSVFDVQVKRLHEYKRQHLNLLNIIAEYQFLLNNPTADFVPKTYIFAAKAAPGYYLAKQIIKAIWSLGEEIRKNKAVADKLSVYFLEDYRVTLSELLMPAAEISEQISLAGTEASGTGNMKLMLNGAITLGTLDGANVEIKRCVGDDNIVIFGMKDAEVENLKPNYHPIDWYNNNGNIKNAVDMLTKGINGSKFDEIANSLKNKDPYMVLADFDAYHSAQEFCSTLYKDRVKWQQMSLANIAGAGFFSADRAVLEYADNIWNL